METVQAIAQVGFPSVAFVLLYRLYREERKRAREEREQAREERSEWMDAISEHTEAVKSLRRSLDRPAVTDGGRDRDE